MSKLFDQLNMVGVRPPYRWRPTATACRSLRRLFVCERPLGGRVRRVTAAGHVGKAVERLFEVIFLV